MRRLLSALLVVLGLGLSGSPVSASESIWSALVYATNETTPTAIPKPLEPFGAKLEAIFGYNQLQLLSEHRTLVDNKSEPRWLLPGKPFCVGVQSKGFSDGNYRFALQLYQEKRLLVETEAQLGRKSPIFVRGPLYGKGQLVIVLVVE